MPTIEQYLAVINAARPLGAELAAVIMHIVDGHARDVLTPAELTQLRAEWQSDVDRTAHNAGIDPPKP